ncbi:MAG: efflux RND transporter periplasmic adaptor subunit [Varibaculum sp.]|nr:efflux RND transporter periplasmic adaptor subunit [Varibaculum sp.]
MSEIFEPPAPENSAPEKPDVETATPTRQAKRAERKAARAARRLERAEMKAAKAAHSNSYRPGGKGGRAQMALKIIRTFIWAVIAVALVKFAFFPSQEPLDEIAAEGNFVLPTVTVENGNIENSIELDATVVRNESKPVKATAEGIITTIYAANGDNVGYGAPILQVKHTDMGETADPDAEPTQSVSYVDIYAPASGTLNIDAIVGQATSIGDPVGTIIPNAFHALVTVTPEQLYSLQALPKTATVAITGGPAPFTCTGLKTITGVGSVTSTEDSDGQQSATTPQLRCDIPSEQTVYDGVKAKLQINGGSAKDVLTLPVTAVEGRSGTGNVYLPVSDKRSKPKAVKVQLGLSDGTAIEIKSGLKAGDEVLEYVPGSSDEQDSAGGGTAI